jgi:hypothetical protein
MYIENDEKLNTICMWLDENMPTATYIVYTDGQFIALNIKVQDEMDATIMELKWL